MQYVLAAIIGLFGGLTSGLFGVGGGIVMVPAMVYLLHANIKTAVGTSLVVIIPTALTSAGKHHQLGNIDWRMAASLIPLAVLGGFLGAALTKPLPAEALKKLFGGFMILAGLRVLFFK
ncbi:MAG TPA: sulfite exporter TauE/SafE family protein [Candidatus Binatia bacterium]|nr:sulfite exporter TauE/SafE family protein [Candidatus Binatia bacterium]